MPHKSSIPLVWRQKNARYKLVGAVCEKCKRVVFPPRVFCECGGKTKTHGLSGIGVVVSYTTIRTAPRGFEQYAPYMVGIIILDEGPAITAPIISGGIKIGDTVRVVFRKLQEDGERGLIHYGYKFVKAS